MNSDRDPKLQALFAQANTDLDTERFTRDVMSRVDRLRRRTMVGWAAGGVVLIVFAAMIATPVQDAVGIATKFLPQSLVELENRWAAQLLSPINSVAGIVAITLLGLRAAYGKLFR